MTVRKHANRGGRFSYPVLMILVSLSRRTLKEKLIDYRKRLTTRKPLHSKVSRVHIM